MQRRTMAIFPHVPIEIVGERDWRQRQTLRQYALRMLVAGPIFAAIVLSCSSGSPQTSTWIWDGIVDAKLGDHSPRQDV